MRSSYQHLEKLFRFLSRKEQEYLQQFTTQTRVVEAENILVRKRIPLSKIDRPEDDDIDTPPTVERIRRMNELDRRLRETETKVGGLKSALKRVFNQGSSLFDE